jgi:hypothetical protein
MPFRWQGYVVVPPYDLKRDQLSVPTCPPQEDWPLVYGGVVTRSDVDSRHVTVLGGTGEFPSLFELLWPPIHPLTVLAASGLRIASKDVDSRYCEAFGNTFVFSSFVDPALILDTSASDAGDLVERWCQSTRHFSSKRLDCDTGVGINYHTHEPTYWMRIQIRHRRFPFPRITDSDLSMYRELCECITQLGGSRLSDAAFHPR